MSKPKRPDLSMAFASLAASAQPGQRDDVTAPFPLDASAPSPDNVIMLQTDSASALSPGIALMPFPDGAKGLQRDVVQAFEPDDATTSTPDSAPALQPDDASALPTDNAVTSQRLDASASPRENAAPLPRDNVPASQRGNGATGRRRNAEAAPRENAVPSPSDAVGALLNDLKPLKDDGVKRRMRDERPHTSIYLHPEVMALIKIISIKERVKAHDIYVEGVRRALEARGYDFDKLNRGGD